MSTMVHYIDDDRTYTTKNCMLDKSFKAPFSYEFSNHPATTNVTKHHFSSYRIFMASDIMHQHNY
jgi:hypothetical protein